MKTNTKIKTISIGVFSLLMVSLLSCNDDLVDHSFDTQDTLGVTISDSEIILKELLFDTAIDLNWSSGTNQNTGAAIKYTLQVDHAAGDFSNPIVSLVTDVQNTYSFNTNYGNLNQLLLDHGLEPDQSYDLTAMITANVSNVSVPIQVATVNFTATTFKPITHHLYIVGDASPNGWNIGSDTEF